MSAVHPIVAALTTARRRYGWTQDDLARKIGVGQSAVSAWERQLRKPDLDTLDRWAAALGRTLQLSNPADRRPRVVVDPAQRFGQPQVKGVSVDAIVGMVRAENGDIDGVADEYGLTRGDVLVACWWAAIHGSRRDRADWGTWAEQAGQAMWHASTCDYTAIPDPPTGGDA